MIRQHRHIYLDKLKRKSKTGYSVEMVTSVDREVDEQIGRDIFNEVNPHQFLMAKNPTRFYDLNCLNQKQCKNILLMILHQSKEDHRYNDQIVLVLKTPYKFENSMQNEDYNQTEDEAHYKMYNLMIAQHQKEQKDPTTVLYDYLCNRGYDCCYIQSSVEVICIKL